MSVCMEHLKNACEHVHKGCAHDRACKASIHVHQWQPRRIEGMKCGWPETPIVHMSERRAPLADRVSYECGWR